MVFGIAKDVRRRETGMPEEGAEGAGAGAGNNSQMAEARDPRRLSFMAHGGIYAGLW